MDDPELDPAVHREALAGLRRINWWSRAAAPLWRAVHREATIASSGRPLSVLDVGSGSGDLAVALACRAAEAGVSLRVAGCDISPVAVAAARDYAAVHGQLSVEFHCRDILSDDRAGEQFDIVCCSLFLHHFTSARAVEVLRRMAQLARKWVMVADLRRTVLGYGLAWAGCRLLTRSPVVHVDGPRSVAGAFSVAEVLELAAQAGLREISVRRHWPQRFLLCAAPPSGAFEHGV